MEKYAVSSSSFSERASALAASDRRADLLYAALELRLGIEARVQSYVHANEQISNQLKKGYHAGKLTSALRATHSDGRNVAIIEVRPKSGSDGCRFEFIPLSSNLSSAYDKLGNFLHYKEKGPSFTDEWWGQLGVLLPAACKDLEVCVRGNLLGVPLWKRSTNQLSLKIELPNGDHRLDLIKGLFESGKEHEIGVEYVPTDIYYARAHQEISA